MKELWTNLILLVAIIIGMAVASPVSAASPDYVTNPDAILEIETDDYYEGPVYNHERLELLGIKQYQTYPYSYGYVFRALECGLTTVRFGDVDRIVYYIRIEPPDTVVTP